MEGEFLVGDIHKTAYYPPLMNYFIEINEEEIFNSFNDLRHPGGIFNITSLYILQSLSQLIDSTLDENSNYDKLYNDLRLVVYDFFKFYDSCFEVMACFCKTGNKLGKGFIHQWIKNNNFTCSTDFENSLRTNLSIIKRLYNQLKHTSNRIGWINIVDVDGNKSIGYYLEKRDSLGCAAPINAIDYPISLNREIRNLYFLIFKISSVLKNILSIHIENWNKNIVFKQSNRILDSTTWFDLFQKIKTLPELFLYNEIGQTFYVPIVRDNLFIFQKEIITKDIWDKSFHPPLRLQPITGGDGYTKSFSFPHMGLVKNKNQLDI